MKKMEIIDLNKIEPKEEKFSAERLIQQEEVQVVLLPFTPGQGLEVHTTPVDVFFYVIEGTAEIQPNFDSYLHFTLEKVKKIYLTGGKNNSFFGDYDLNIHRFLGFSP